MRAKLRQLGRGGRRYERSCAWCSRRAPRRLDRHSVTAPRLGEGDQTLFDTAIDAARREAAVATAFASGHASQNLDALVNGGGREDAEFAGGNGFDHVIAQHQML